MGKTIAEKIIARAAKVDQVQPGDIVWVDVDRAMMDDILGPRIQIAKQLEQLGRPVWDPDRVVIISDHYTPPATIHQAEIVKFTRDWAKKNGIKKYYEFEGPCHQVMAETKNVLPGTIILGTDSHTCMGGALNAFASGVGSTEMLGILATGQTWLRVPESIEVVWNGNLKKGVMAKDISLYTIGKIGHAGATYLSVEYKGETIGSLPMDERMAITNMAVEMGAKAGIMPFDEVTEAFLKGIGVDVCHPVSSDKDARYLESYVFDAEDLKPQVACPHQVDNVTEVDNMGNVPIHQAYLGSCTGGRLNDLKMAAEYLEGKKVCSGVRLLVSPASRSIWREADRLGYLQTIAEAGGVIMAPTCGVCVGLHSGLIAAGETCISSSNRNFLGRMGSKEGQIYLGSPLTVAASAVAGRISSAVD